MAKPLEQFDREISAAENQIDQKRQELEDFEIAIATLKQPVAASIGTSPTETMIQIVGDAATQKERDQRLKDAQLAANKHREEIIKLENSLSKLKEQKKVTEKQLIWDEIYEPHRKRLRAEWTRPAEIEQKILKCLSQMETHRQNVERLEKLLAGWTEEEKKRLEIKTGIRANPNYADELKTQIKSSEQGYSRAYNEIQHLENIEEERLFRAFVMDTVDKENALESLKPHFETLRRLNLRYRKVAQELQSKIEQYPVIRHIKIEIPQEVDYEQY